MKKTDLDARCPKPVTIRRGKKKFATLRITTNPCMHCKKYSTCIVACDYKVIHENYMRQIREAN